MTTLHTFSNRHIKSEVKNIKKGDYIYLENSLSKKRWSLYFRAASIDENELNLNYITEEEYFIMTKQFDNIVGNPPFQDGAKKGGQNKLYNAISKKSLSLLSDTGTISFVTPIPVTRPNKRFTIVGEPGLKNVDFSADNKFSEGITVCSWHIDRSFVGDVSVTNIDNSINDDCTNALIFDSTVTSGDFLSIFQNIRKHSKNLNNRMFQRNNFGPSLQTFKDKTFVHPLYTNKDLDAPNWYSSRTPHFQGNDKFVLRLSGSFSEPATMLSNKDFDLNHIVCEVSSKDEFDNINSFLFSDYFIKFANAWKDFISSKSYDILVYLPIFDKTIHWTNEEVKEFIESFAH